MINKMINKTIKKTKQLMTMIKKFSDLSNNLVNSNYKDENKNKEENNVLKTTTNSAVKKSQEIKDNIDLPDAIETTLQKSGYCFIGNLNDVRYCSEISAKNKCMSGEIFPSMDLCINRILNKLPCIMNKHKVAYFCKIQLN